MKSRASAAEHERASPVAQPPRRLRRGPPITLTCECGERSELHYGERWRCEKCGRTWDTKRIPVEQYAAIVRGQRRQVIEPLTVLLLIATLVAVLVLVGRALAAIVLVPIVLYVWGQFVRPAFRRRRYREVSELPRWEIKPE